MSIHFSRLTLSVVFTFLGMAPSFLQAGEIFPKDTSSRAVKERQRLLGREDERKQSIDIETPTPKNIPSNPANELLRDEIMQNIELVPGPLNDRRLRDAPEFAAILIGSEDPEFIEGIFIRHKNQFRLFICNSSEVSTLQINADILEKPEILAAWWKNGVQNCNELGGYSPYTATASLLIDDHSSAIILRQDTTEEVRNRSLAIGAAGALLYYPARRIKEKCPISIRWLLAASAIGGFANAGYAQYRRNIAGEIEIGYLSHLFTSSYLRESQIYVFEEAEYGDFLTWAQKALLQFERSPGH